MRLTDASRVLKGTSLVIDQIIARSRPEAAWRFERAKFHLSELFNVIVEVANEKQANNGQTTQNMYNEDSSKATYNHVAAEVNEENFSTDFSVENHPPQPKPEVFVDPIGFSNIVEDTISSSTNEMNLKSSSTERMKKMQERAVPSTQFGRFVGFGSLAFRMAMGEAVDRAAHVMSGNNGPRYISDENAERLAESLCRMRGAALKLGQILSLQDESSLPPSLTKALDRVRQAADYMPKRQLEAQLISQLGEDWRSKLLEFDEVPIAAASIGQVHRAKLLDGTEVAMKIQYPGVADSIDSDLTNLKRLVQITNLLPPGLFVDKIIEVASVELKEECMYTS